MITLIEKVAPEDEFLALQEPDCWPEDTVNFLSLMVKSVSHKELLAVRSDHF
jgi:hypothetical protein